ncbi:MAG: hypothetical protein ABIA75_13625 [Candidatus Neomarinimicrobiota bacterium]
MNIQIVTLIIASVSVLTGILLLFFPSKLTNAIENTNIIVFTDSLFFRYPYLTGAVLTVIGVGLLTVYVQV